MSRALSTAPAGSQRPSVAHSLPVHEPPQNPLTPDAQRMLANLMQTHNLSKLKAKLDKADKLVTEMAGDVNDRLYYHTEQQRKRAARRAAGSPGEDDEEELEKEVQDLEQLKTKVDKMTERMEESVRKVIDGQTSVASLEEAVRHVQRTSVGSATQIPSQSQRRARGSDDADGDTQMASFNPTAPPGSSTQNVPAPTEVLSKKLQTHKEDYYNLSLKTRYGQHNSYIAFKSTVHDAQNPGEDAPPLSHHSTWFNNEGSPAPGVMRDGAAGNEDDSDDDVAIAREKISTKCPLTLREFEDPVTSKKCPHTFEKKAILELIKAQRGRGAQCPVPGCSQHLLANDLHANPILIRKIRRIQKSRLAQDDEDEEMGDDSQLPSQSSAVDIDDDDESGDEI